MSIERLETVAGANERRMKRKRRGVGKQGDTNAMITRYTSLLYCSLLVVPHTSCQRIKLPAGTAVQLRAAPGRSHRCSVLLDLRHKLPATSTAVAGAEAGKGQENDKSISHHNTPAEQKALPPRLGRENCGRDSGWSFSYTFGVSPERRQLSPFFYTPQDSPSLNLHDHRFLAVSTATQPWLAFRIPRLPWP